MKQDGSITVFAALSFLLIASFLFALLEAGRVQGLNAYAELKTTLGVESTGAEYQPVLWEKYHMLCLDGSYGEGELSMECVTGALSRRIKSNLEITDSYAGGVQLFTMELAEAVPVEYQLLTDGDGAVFIHMAADCMKEQLADQAIQLLIAQYTQSSEISEEDTAEYGVERADEAIRAAREAQEEAENKETDTQNAADGETTSADGNGSTDGQVSADGNGSTDGQTSGEMEENPLEVIKSLKQNAVLELVVQDSSALSDKEVDIAQRASVRSLQQGDAEDAEEPAITEKLLAVEYMGEFFSDYTDATGQALSYELEYILCGKSSDRENLEAAVSKLLLFREAANFLYLMKDSTKMEQAMVVATALAGFTGNPAIIKLVQLGVAAAWAFAESILDVRALLQGDKISLMKSSTEWTVDVAHLADSLSDGKKSENSENGLTYEQYLKMLLFLENNRTLAYRAMDVMEFTICATEGFENFRVDSLLCSFTYQVAYHANLRFYQLAIAGREIQDGFYFQVLKEFSYY